MNTPPKEPKQFDYVHVDGDILLYELCSTHEYTARFDDDLDVVFCNLNAVVASVASAMDSYAKWFGSPEVSIYFTGPNNYRKAVYPQYKAHRKKVRKPCGYRAMRDHLEASGDYFVGIEDCLEADDYIGIHHTRRRLQGASSVIVSTDKDFATIPGCKFNPDTGEYAEHSEAEADRNWLIQTLTGDRTDGYPGLEGVGPVKANRLLGDSGGWLEVLLAYEDAGCSEEYAVTMARMARILRHGEYDFTTKHVKLWEPSYEPRPAA